MHAKAKTCDNWDWYKKDENRDETCNTNKWKYCGFCKSGCDEIIDAKLTKSMKK